MIKKISNIFKVLLLAGAKILTTSREDIAKQNETVVNKTPKKEKTNERKRTSATKSSNRQNSKVKRGNDTRRKNKGSKKL